MAGRKVAIVGPQSTNEMIRAGARVGFEADAESGLALPAGLAAERAAARRARRVLPHAFWKGLRRIVRDASAEGLSINLSCALCREAIRLVDVDEPIDPKKAIVRGRKALRCACSDRVIEEGI